MMNQFKTTILAASITSLTSLYLHASQEISVEKKFKISQVNNLDLENSSGDITIKTDDKEAKVKVEKIEWDNEACSLEIGEKEGILSVKAKNKSSKFSFLSFFSRKKVECQTKIIVSLPLETDLKVLGGSGKISITGIHGSYDVQVGSGDIEIKEAKGSQLEAKTGSGNLQVSGAFAGANLKTGSGHITLNNQTAPLKIFSLITGSGNINYTNETALTSGKTIIKTGTGNTEINLAETSEFKVHFVSGVGKASSEFAKQQEKKHKISVTTGVGNLKIKKIKTEATK